MPGLRPEILDAKRRSAVPVSCGFDNWWPNETEGRCSPILACARIPGMKETEMKETEMKETMSGHIKSEDTKFWVALSRVPQLGSL